MWSVCLPSIVHITQLAGVHSFSRTCCLVTGSAESRTRIATSVMLSFFFLCKDRPLLVQVTKGIWKTHKMTLGQLIKHDWMDYSLLACKCFFFFLWTNKTFAQHLLVIDCGVLHIYSLWWTLCYWKHGFKASTTVQWTRQTEETRTQQHIALSYHGTCHVRTTCQQPTKKSGPTLRTCAWCQETWRVFTSSPKQLCRENATCALGKKTHGAVPDTRDSFSKLSATWKCTWNVVTMPRHWIFVQGA